MWGGGGAYWLGGTGVNVFYFTMNPNFKYKKKRFFWGGGGGGRGGGGGGGGGGGLKKKFLHGI